MSAPSAPPPPLAARSAFVSVARSHQGCVRACNEDRYLVRQDVGFWAVADGMGGHDAGDVASALIVEALAGLRLGDAGGADIATVERCLQRANGALQARARSMRGGVIGSTIVALLANAREYICLWAGDSRAYVRRGCHLTQISRDHSVVQQLIDEKRLHASEAKSHPRLNVITRAVGAAPDLILERRRAATQAGDLFLLCSDGLSSALEDAEINELLVAASLDLAADRLVDLALRRGAADNVTVVLIGRQ